jgi:hypothetical protein
MGSGSGSGSRRAKITQRRNISRVDLSLLQSEDPDLKKTPMIWIH